MELSWSIEDGFQFTIITVLQVLEMDVIRRRVLINERLAWPYLAPLYSWLYVPTLSLLSH